MCNRRGIPIDLSSFSPPATEKTSSKDSVSHSASRGGSDQQPTSATTPMTPAGGDLSEMVSMGGESLGSFSEDFETVSFAEESGLPAAACSIERKNL